MTSRSKISLPVDARLGEICDLLKRSSSVVVTAPPGAGKTTRIPPALMADGPVLLVQPRRVAARAVPSRSRGNAQRERPRMAVAEVAAAYIM